MALTPVMMAVMTQEPSVVREVDPLAAHLETAAAHAMLRVPVASPGDRVDEVLTGMRGRHFDSAAVLAVCVHERLVGVATLERMLAASSESTVAQVMDPDPPVVEPGADQEHAAWVAVQHGEPGLAVVDSSGRFRGLIPPQRLLAVLLAEHDEDLARLGGFLRSTDAARGASLERVRRRLWHRLPWLLLGLAGAIISAAIVGAFEAQLQRHVLIAFFVPGVVYLADAVGTQTETLTIRGLSVGVRLRRVARMELITGMLVGTVLALAAFPVVTLGWGDAQVASAVSAAVFAACTIATGVALGLPWLLVRLGKDPAFGAGPLATVIQDLLSIVIYLSAATVILG
jgi:magnesium transporter